MRKYESGSIDTKATWCIILQMMCSDIFIDSAQAFERLLYLLTGVG